MKTKNPDIQKIIDYLQKHICGSKNSKFYKIGPREFVYGDGLTDEKFIDTIIVKITDTNLIILSGGNGAIDQTEMISIITPLGGGSDTEEELEEMINRNYLQPILHKF